MDVVDRLTRAAEEGDAASVTQSLDAGAEVDAVGTAGRTSLDLAVHAGHARIVRVLLAAGADPRQPAGEYSELTPMCLAAMYGHTAVVGALLDAGAPIGAQGRRSYVPLVLAATSVERGHLETVDLLLRHGADINGTMKGKTPLEWAAAFGQVSVVRQLLARGATPTAKALNEARAGAERHPRNAEKYRLVNDALHAAGVED
ncbi:ankyrin repeat domain-containing protein [Streptomyces bikiniensis]|uniref:ankyrin repeat domain-containing protein n=1 Tax=Streptomyces bikiniensis TaxID=1896 RepID=UPI000997318A|nr:ankyrin repeat domain-containing protein [Streptomyces bikiniensis]